MCPSLIIGLCDEKIDQHIRVCVRIRPIIVTNTEFNNTDTNAWNWGENTITLKTNNDKQLHTLSSPTIAVGNNRQQAFNFDHLFHPEHTNHHIFTSVVENVVASAMNGYHGSVFSYGQTSSGKTFTMNGGSTQPGIIPLAIQYCFDAINSYPTREFMLRVSYLEVYNEQVNDLLNDSKEKEKDIKIQHDPKVGTVISGAKETVVQSAEQVINLLKTGEVNRHIGSTDMNEKSSRAHTLFRIIIESKERDDQAISGENPPCKVSTLNLVDLTGSECAKMTNSRGSRAREGKFINQSLLTLSTIIQRLSEDSNRQQSVASGSTLRRQHLPYRDSKLTRILESALDGNAQIAIICTISPASRCVDESLNTLKFAARAKLIKMNARVNEVLDDKTLLKSYRKEILQLRTRLHRKDKSDQNNDDEESNEDDDEFLDDTPNLNEEEVVLRMITEMEKLILKADLKKVKPSTRLSVGIFQSLKRPDDGKENQCTTPNGSAITTSSSASLKTGRAALSPLPITPNGSNNSAIITPTYIEKKILQIRGGDDGIASKPSPSCSSGKGSSEDTVLFGVTKILSVMREYVISSKSRRNSSNLTTSGKGDESEVEDSSDNAVEYVLNKQSWDELDDIGSLARAQYERFKTDFRLQEVDNYNLKKQLENKEHLLFLLSNGLKEVEVVRENWQKAMNELSEVKEEKEKLQKEVDQFHSNTDFIQQSMLSLNLANQFMSKKQPNPSSDLEVEVIKLKEENELLKKEIAQYQVNTDYVEQCMSMMKTTLLVEEEVSHIPTDRNINGGIDVIQDRMVPSEDKKNFCTLFPFLSSMFSSPPSSQPEVLVQRIPFNSFIPPKENVNVTYCRNFRPAFY